MTSPYHSRPTRAQRDGIVDRLRDAVSNGDLTLEEFEERLDAAYAVESNDELLALVANLPLRPPVKRRMSNSSKALIGAAAVLCFLIGAVVLNASAGHTPSSDAPASAAPAQPSSTNINAAVVSAGEFVDHDPADKCGAFGTATVVGGNNCYLVVQFTNSGSSTEEFAPADLQMKDQTGDTYSIAPVLPTCYDTTDVNALQVIHAHESLTVQLCYPVMTGALPQELLGKQTLEGLNVSVSEGSVVGTWGGA
jgi:hypothetical protein